MGIVIYMCAMYFISCLAAAYVAILPMQFKKKLDKGFGIKINGAERTARFESFNMLSLAPIKIKIDDSEHYLLSGVSNDLNEQRKILRFEAVCAVIVCAVIIGGFLKLSYKTLISEHNILGTVALAIFLYDLCVISIMAPLTQFRKCAELSCRVYSEQDKRENQETEG